MLRGCRLSKSPNAAPWNENTRLHAFWMHWFERVEYSMHYNENIFHANTLWNNTTEKLWNTVQSVSIWKATCFDSFGSVSAHYICWLLALSLNPQISNFRTMQQVQYFSNTQSRQPKSFYGQAVECCWPAKPVTWPQSSCTCFTFSRPDSLFFFLYLGQQYSKCFTK